MRLPIALVVCVSLLLVVPAAAQRQRCGTPDRGLGFAGTAPSDCGYFENTPQAEYEPGAWYDIPVVFHVIQDTNGDGFLSAETIQDQIDILNEDFNALPGTPGAPGTEGRIRFHLATTDPNGAPTTGITYTTDASWYDDSGNYWSPLAWDTNRYLNIYTNAPPCCYGYVEDFPSTGIVGQDRDRVVVWWEAVGRDPTPGWPGNQGRTTTHEVGHYLGLYHTFEGCGSVANCGTNGDLICDTNPQSSSTSGCPASKSSCSSPDPFRNYMDYTDDACTWEFTPEQVNRMRCTLENWRPQLPVFAMAEEVVRVGSPANPNALLPGNGGDGPVLGEVWAPRIDHGSFLPGAVTDILLVSLTAVNLPAGPKGTLLCDFPSPIFLMNPVPGSPFVLPIPPDGQLLGIPFCAQGASTEGGGVYRLTNALDCVLGQ